MTDIIERAEKALEVDRENREAYGIDYSDGYMAPDARTLLPEAIEEIKRLEAKANQMVADKINLRSELLSVQAKLAVAVAELDRLNFDWECIAGQEIKGERP